jgi:hypothetical protein
MMRSLACIRHPCWDETIAQIIERGGKPALGTHSAALCVWFEHSLTSFRLGSGQGELSVCVRWNLLGEELYSARYLEGW